MKVARAKKEDVDVIYDLLGALDRIKDGESFEEDEESEGIGWCELQDAFDAGEDGYVPNRVNHYIRQAMKYLLDTCYQGEGMRAVMNLSVLLDQKNKVIDPQSRTLDFHPDIKKGFADTVRLDWLAKNDCALTENLGDEDGDRQDTPFAVIHVQEEHFEVLAAANNIRQAIDTAMQAQAAEAEAT